MAKRIALVLILLVGVLGALGTFLVSRAEATDSDKRLFDRNQVEISTGTAYIDTSAADYTSYQTLITIEPNTKHALQDVKVVIDLDKASTGFASASGYDTETIQFSIARKVDGTNWRTATNKATTALAADNADGLSVELDIGLVCPDEDVRVMVKLSAEAAGDVALPYVIYYRSGATATVTAATN